MANRTSNAIIDTAAESTIISDRIFQTLYPKPPTLCKMKFLTAGRDMSMSDEKIGPIQLRISSSVYSEVVHVESRMSCCLISISWSDNSLRYVYRYRTQNRPQRCLSHKTANEANSSPLRERRGRGCNQDAGGRCDPGLRLT